MHVLLLLALAIWPFTPRNRPGHRHTRANHARHLRHVQEARTHRLTRQHHAAHPTLVRFR